MTPDRLREERDHYCDYIGVVDALVAVTKMWARAEDRLRSRE